MEKDKHLLELFWTFLKIGAFTFGGGYAMISLVQAEIVTRKHWVSQQEYMDMIAISQATPGVIAINTATFVGYKVGGFWGSVLSTLGVTIPSYLIIGIISYFLATFLAMTWIAYAFDGIRAGIIVLIFDAVIKMGRTVKRNAFNIVLGGIAFLLAALTTISVVWLILAGGLIGIVWQIFILKNFGEGAADE